MYITQILYSPVSTHYYFLFFLPPKLRWPEAGPAQTKHSTPWSPIVKVDWIFRSLCWLWIVSNEWLYSRLTQTFWPSMIVMFWRGESCPPYLVSVLDIPQNTFFSPHLLKGIYIRKNHRLYLYLSYSLSVLVNWNVYF